MAAIGEEQVRMALKSVVDRDRGADVISAGMISGVHVRGGHVAFAIEVRAEEGAQKESLRKACEKAVEAIPGVLSVSAVLTATRGGAKGGNAPEGGHTHAPGHLHGHDHGHDHGSAKPSSVGANSTPTTGGTVQKKPGIPGVRSLVAVASGKGGVGKSTTAVNLALGLKAIGLKVGLLDADIYGPSIPRMLGVSGRPNSPDGRRIEPMRAYGMACMSIGFMVGEETPVIWRGPMVMSALEQMLRDVAWEDLDVLVIDLPPGTGDAQLTLAQRAPLTGAVIVSTPQDIALIDARKGLAMFQKVDVPVFGIVENMSYFLCPHCGERSDIFGYGGARLTAEKLGVEFLGEVPLHMSIRETSDAGMPIVATQPDSEQARIYLTIARRVSEKISESLGAAERTAPTIVIQ
ncbi:MAG: iron-sulfur cluster carrier protein ApbC [Alphaproteobacteria bacterium]|nr:iron-sulfur cluster carrier protein ApbC [Alphaproteobacteria bacterium]